MPDSIVDLRRDLVGKTFTIGRLYVNNQLIGKTLEYPWRDNTSWDDNKTKGENFFHTSCIRPGKYPAFIRFDHFRNTDQGLIADWRLELEDGKRLYIQFHVGNRLIKDSKGCILVGEEIHIPRNSEPSLVNSKAAMNKFIASIFGQSADTPSEWAKLMRELKITVQVHGLPPIY